MKTIILATLLVLAFSSTINFEKDSNEGSPIGVFTKGFFNPATSGEAKIESFLRLANELIPLAEVSSANQHPEGQRLGYGYIFCTGHVGDIFNACFHATAELWIGWSVTQGNGNVTGNFAVTYTPFTFLRAGANVSVESYPAEVGYGGYVSIIDITIPIFASIGQSALCYSGNFNFAPGAFFTQISTALLECEWVITTSGQPKTCGKVFGPNFQHLSFPLWNGYQNAFLSNTCFNF